MWLQITINRVKTLPQSLNSSMGQLLLIGSQIGYHTFEYQHTKKSFKNRVIFWGGGGSSKDHFGSQGGGGGGLLGAKKGSHDFLTLP